MEKEGRPDKVWSLEFTNEEEEEEGKTGSGARDPGSGFRLNGSRIPEPESRFPFKRVTVY